LVVRPGVLLMIAGSGLVTVIPRVLPLIALRRFTLPGWAFLWLGNVPIAVIAALLARTLLLDQGRISLPPHNPAPLAIVPAFLVAVFTRSLIFTVLVGVASMAVLRLLLH
jgi:branched chain amino acid efflux pump